MKRWKSRMILMAVKKPNSYRTGSTLILLTGSTKTISNGLSRFEISLNICHNKPKRFLNRKDLSTLMKLIIYRNFTKSISSDYETACKYLLNKLINLTNPYF